MTKRSAPPTLQMTLADLRQASVAQLAALDQVIAAAQPAAAAAATETDDDKPKWLSVDEIVTDYNISRNTLYVSVLDHVVTRKLGRRLLVSRKSMDAFFAGLPTLPATGRRHLRGRAPKGGRKAA